MEDVAGLVDGAGGAGGVRLAGLDGDEEADVSARISEMITKGINGDFGNDLLMKGKLKQKLSSLVF